MYNYCWYYDNAVNQAVNKMCAFNFVNQYLNSVNRISAFTYVNQCLTGQTAWILMHTLIFQQ